MCTTLECQAHFGQKGSPTERQSRRKAVFFVVALKVARGSQRAKERTRTFVESSKQIRNKNGGKQKVPKPLCFTRPNGLREKKEPKRGPSFFKKRCASAAPGAFGESAKTPQGGACSNLRELGTGSALVFECCASNCEHSHRCPRSLCEAGKAQEPARTPPRASLMRPKRP